MQIKSEILKKLQEVVKKITKEELHIQLSIPKDISNGDFTTNVAFQLGKSSGIHSTGSGQTSPLEMAQEIVQQLQDEPSTSSGKKSSLSDSPAGEESKGLSGIDKVEAVAPGFINFYLSIDSLSKNLDRLLKSPEKVAQTTSLKNKKIMVEFAHPNTHKELHIGHMRTLTTGESLARILEANGAEVFRANYQGDIGPHVAKAMYGVQKIMQEQKLNLETIEKWPYSEKAHFLGLGYARGSKDYEGSAKEEIDSLNVALYKRDPLYKELYQLTRQWSLDYYDEFYKRFYTKFDKLFFEGDLDKESGDIVRKYVGKVFHQDKDGSIVFVGEKYGLHTRVFITQKGNPTYEGKEIALGFAEYKAFPFDMKIHVVASEQAGYFQVVFKALELIDKKKFEGHQYHLSMGMVQLIGRKMSSRTGDVLTVDELLDKVKEAALSQFKKDKEVADKEKILEQVVIGAVKYAILKGGVRQDAKFDIETSVSLDGNSGPYIQYTFARTQSILEKSQSNYSSLSDSPAGEESKGLRQAQAKNILSLDYTPSSDDKKLMQKIVQFTEVVENAATSYAPNMVAEYIFELSQMFNNFYQKYRILNAEKEEEKEFRLALTSGVGIILKQGLYLLGIEAPQKM